jgi:hypothetical protein
MLREAYNCRGYDASTLNRRRVLSPTTPAVLARAALVGGPPSAPPALSVNIGAKHWGDETGKSAK